MRKPKKYLCLILTLLLMISMSVSVGAESVVLEFDALAFGINDECIKVVYDGVPYMICNDGGRQDINLRMIDADECEAELEAQVDKKPTIRLLWLGIGLVAGLLGGVAIAK